VKERDKIGKMKGLIINTKLKRNMEYKYGIDGFAMVGG
jgi:hypothetical protein